MEFANHGILRVLVDARLVLDVLGTRSVTQRRKRLVDVVVSRAQIRDHHRLCVASKRVLQDTCQLGVTIGDVGALGISQTRDNVTECRQGQVDLGSLFEALTRCSSLALPFGARQIDNVQLSYFDMRLALFVHLGTFHCDGEHGMRA